MFSPARVSLYSEQRIYSPPSPPTAAQRRAISAARVLLMMVVASLGVFTAGRIFFAGAPLGGAADLMTLYAATAVLALGLAGLFELRTSDEEPADASNGGGGRYSHRISGVFRRTRDEGLRFLTRALDFARVG